MVKNLYPELPEVAFKRTSIEMPLIVLFAKSLKGKYPLTAIRMAYAIFRNESANGAKGVNNNYGGIQADNARWKGLPGEPIATCVKIDSGNVARRFICFPDDTGYKISFELMVIKSTERNMVTAADYFKKWVGKTNPSALDFKSFNSLLNSAEKAIQ